MSQKLMIAKGFAFAICLLNSVSALTPNYCWDFSNAGATIANSCSGPTSSLTKNGAPLCDFSGCSFSTGDFFEGEVPIDIGSVWTIVLWVKPFLQNGLTTAYSLYNNAASQVVGELRMSVMGMRYKHSLGEVMHPIGSNWSHERWAAFYVYSDATSSSYGFGAYLAHYQSTSEIKEKQTSTPFDYTAAALAPSDYMLRFGADDTGSAAIQLIRRVELFVGVALNKQTMSSQLLQAISSMHQDYLDYACPQLLSGAHEVCAGNDWIHYKLAQAFVTNSAQTLVDQSGNGLDGQNGSTSSVDPSDGTLGQFGMDMAGTQILHTPGIPAGESYTSYSIQIYTLYSPTLGPTFTLFENSDLKIQVNSLDITVHYKGIAVSTQTCMASAGRYELQVLEYQPRLFALSLLQNGVNSVQLDFFINTQECMSLALTDVAVPVSASTIGDGFIGTITEFKITKLVKGKEAYQGFQTNYICGTSGQFDWTNRVCVNCDVSCNTCSGSTSFDCTECASGYVFSLEGECRLCGNGIMDAGQQCDDSNMLDGDGCNSQCQFESEEAACAGNVSLCKEITPLLIEQVKFETKQDDLLMTIHLSREVFVSNLNLHSIAFQFSGVEATLIALSMDQVANLEVRSFEIKLTPSVSLDGTETLSFNLTCINTLFSLDQFTSTPPYLVKDSVLLSAFEYQSATYSQTMRVAGFVMEGATGFNLAGGILTSMTLQITLQPLWGFINSNQLIFFIPLIGVTLPRNAMTLFAVLSFVNGDFYVLELAYKNSVGRSISTEMENPPNFRFESLGFSGSSIIENCGILFLLLTGKIVLLLFFVFLSRVCRWKWTRKCSDLMKWSPFIRFLFQAFFELMICALVNISNVSFHSYAAISAFVISILVMVLLIIFMSKLMYVTAYPRYELSDKESEIRNRYSQIYSGLELKRGFMAQNYFTWFLFRRLLLSVVLVFFPSLPLFQLGVHTLLATTQITILLRSFPFQDKRTLVMLTMNEFHLLILYGMVTALHYCLSLKLYLGWAMVGSILTINLFNIVFMTVLQCKDIRTKLTQLKESRRQKSQYEKYLKERKEHDTSSLGGLAPRSAWEEKPQFEKGSKEEENYIQQKFFCKSARSKAEKGSHSLFHPLAN